jgi:hypothetical protein
LQLFTFSYIQEEHAVIEHVKGDSYPVTIVNTKVKRGDGLQSLENERLPNPYCVVATQEDDQSVINPLMA